MITVGCPKLLNSQIGGKLNQRVTQVRAQLVPMNDAQAKRTRLMTIITLVVFVLWVAIDQISKFWVLDTYEGGGLLNLDWVIVHLVWNPGAAFNLPMPTPVIQGAVALLAAFLIARALPKTNSVILAVCYGAILGGALGNLIDRFIHDGKVVDFIDLNFWPLQSFPVFNVADIGISVGTFIVIIGVALHDYLNRPSVEDKPVREIVSEETDRGIGE